MALPKIKHLVTDLEIPSSKEKITVRQIIAREEKLLLMAKSSPDETKAVDIQQTVKQVINNCIETPNFDIDKLTMFDIEWLYLQLRGISTTSMVTLSYIDNEDQKTYDFDLDLKSVPIKWPDPPKSNIIKINDEISMRLKYPSAALYSDKEFLATTVGSAAAELIIGYCIDSVSENGKEVQFDRSELKEFINEMPIETYTKLYDWIYDMPRIYHEFSYKNENDKDRKIVLQSLNDFFMFL